MHLQAVQKCGTKMRHFVMLWLSCRSRLVTAFHRLAVWPHMCVSDDNAGHDEALVAAVYNTTFQVVSPFSPSSFD